MRKRFTFRSEMAGDLLRVPHLINELDLELIALQRDSVGAPASGYYVDIFTVLYDGTVEELREKMQNLIINDERFVDLHRCFQTLAEGDIHQDP